jgi:hypothetical protein
MLAAANVGVQTLTIWARQNLQLLTPSQSVPNMNNLYKMLITNDIPVEPNQEERPFPFINYTFYLLTQILCLDSCGEGLEIVERYYQGFYAAL